MFTVAPNGIHTYRVSHAKHAMLLYTFIRKVLPALKSIISKKKKKNRKNVCVYAHINVNYVNNLSKKKSTVFLFFWGGGWECKVAGLLSVHPG